MKKILAFALCISFLGCVVAAAQVHAEEKASGESVRRFVSTRQVLKGMSSKEVASVLGQQVLVGYELTEVETGQYKPITIKNPYRSEDIKKGKKLYKVEYYFIGINDQDGEITDDELMPFIFIGDMLIAKDWDYLNKRVKN